MKTTIKLVIALLAFAGVAHATPDMTAMIGKPAPEFTTIDALTGKTLALKDLRGAPVVLEWNNFGCPFVRKHYGSGNMQKLQRAATKDGVHWITINSSADGKQGYLKDGAAVKAALKEHEAAPSHYVLDPKGEIGKTYGAKVTPHMFVIDKDGILVYDGAIDDKPTPQVEDIKTATNHVSTTLAALKENKTIKPTTTKPYGCGVKYAY